jgi:hypothetical protein
MKKLFVLALLCSASLCLGGQHPNPERLADAIYRAEGGAKAKVPYGVLSIRPPAHVQTRAQLEAWARQITLNSIRNNWNRWQALDPRPSTLDHDGFIDFMADRWCPPSADPIGNRNWKKNVKALTK